MKKILFAASEAVPFMKTGGLADVTGSLPKYFDKKNYDVRVILPKYVCMEERWKGQLHFLCHFYVNLSWRKQYVGIFETTYDGITYYLVDNEFYFAGNAPYNNIYEDVEKFAFFSKAVLEALPYLDFCPDIIHCHDWQTGLLPVFLRTLYGDEEYYTGIKTVFSIHNLKFQGRWKLPAVMDITGLPEQIFASDKLESYGEANYLKGGVVYADAVTTVSPTFAYEITTPEGGEGLEGLMYACRDKLSGILNHLFQNMTVLLKDRLHQSLLTAKIIIQRWFGNSGLFCDLLNPHCVISTSTKQFQRFFNDQLPIIHLFHPLFLIFISC